MRNIIKVYYAFLFLFHLTPFSLVFLQYFSSFLSFLSVFFEHRRANISNAIGGKKKKGLISSFFRNENENIQAKQNFRGGGQIYFLFKKGTKGYQD